MFSAKPLKDNIPCHKKIKSGPLTIIPQKLEWFPIGISLVMGLSAGIIAVTVMVVSVMLDLFEICFQNLGISLYKRAIIFSLAKTEPCLIG